MSIRQEIGNIQEILDENKEKFKDGEYIRLASSITNIYNYSTIPNNNREDDIEHDDIEDDIEDNDVVVDDIEYNNIANNRDEELLVLLLERIRDRNRHNVELQQERNRELRNEHRPNETMQWVSLFFSILAIWLGMRIGHEMIKLA
jgi:hypothetical protein